MVWPNRLRNEGALQSIMLLRGYDVIASEIQAFRLPVIFIPKLFRSERIKPSNLWPIPSQAAVAPNTGSKTSSNSSRPAYADCDKDPGTATGTTIAALPTLVVSPTRSVAPRRTRRTYCTSKYVTGTGSIPVEGPISELQVSPCNR